MSKYKINDYIVVDKDVAHGKPVFTGTRVMVWQVLEMLSQGSSEKEIIEAYPTITKKHIRSAFDYTSSITKNSNVMINLNVA